MSAEEIRASSADAFTSLVKAVHAAEAKASVS